MTLSGYALTILGCYGVARAVLEKVEDTVPADHDEEVPASMAPRKHTVTPQEHTYMEGSEHMVNELLTCGRG